MEKLRSWKNTIILLVLVLLGSLLLRLIQLDYLPVFADEAIYIRWSQIMANEPTLRFLPLSDGKQPFYMWVLMSIIDLFSDPLVAGRFVSVIFGLGTGIGIFALTFILFSSKRVSLIAAFLWGMSPFAIFFNRLALVDSTLSFFGIWTALFAVLTARYIRLDTALLGGFFLGGALLTKSPGLFFALMLPVSLLFTPLKRSGRAIQIIKVVMLLGVTLILGYAMQNILRLGPNFHLIATRNADYVYPFAHILTSPLDPLKPHFHRSLEWIWLMGPASLFGLLIFTILSAQKKFYRPILFLFIWTFLPIFAGAAFAKVFTARYIFYSVPFLICLAAVPFYKGAKFLRYAQLLLIFFVIQSAIFINQLYRQIEAAPLPQSERSGYLEEWTAGHGIREIADYLKQEHHNDPNKQIVVGTEGYFGTLPDGLQMYMQGVPNTLVIGIGLNIKEVPDQLYESKKAGNKTYLVINKSRFKGDPDALGFKLLAQYPKALRTPGTHDYVAHGPLEILYFFEVDTIADK